MDIVMRYSLAQTKAGLQEVQNTFHWAIQFVKAPNVIGAPPEDVIIRCSSAAAPDAQVEYNKVELQGHAVNYVGKVTKSGQISLTFIEGTDAKVTAYFFNWIKAMWSGDGNDTYGVQNLTNDLKADIQLSLMGPNDIITQVYTLVGCLPTPQLNLNMEQSSSSMSPSIQIDYDDFHMDAGGLIW